ncbi:MAG: 2,3-bisphosphoglycerate-independent phosphoglycerate mutase [Nitrososphaerota archaeon]
MRVFLIVLDGMADRPSPKIELMTPLQLARKPNIDLLAAGGVTGIMDPVAPGIPVGSDTGHLALLGYDPYVYYSGRGPLEALGAGIDLGPSDIAFRCNFATVSDDWVVIDRRAGRISDEDAEQLSRSLLDLSLTSSRNLEIVFKHTVEHRGVLVIKGEGLSEKVSDVDPHREGVKVHMPRPTDSSENAKRTAEILKEFLMKSKEILENHPINIERRRRGLKMANAVLPRGAGRLPTLPSIGARYGVKGAVVAGGAIYKGVCKAAGMDIINAPGATGTINTNLDSKFRTAIELLNKYDFVFLHIKGTDSASHDKNPELKARFIEKIDSTLGNYLDKITSDVIICITGDHTTCSTVGEHRGDPVPILIHGEGVRTDDTSRFDEFACSKGGLGRIRGLDVLNILFDLANITKMYGE